MKEKGIFSQGRSKSFLLRKQIQKTPPLEAHLQAEKLRMRSYVASHLWPLHYSWTHWLREGHRWHLLGPVLPGVVTHTFNSSRGRRTCEFEVNLIYIVEFQDSKNYIVRAFSRTNQPSIK